MTQHNTVPPHAKPIRVAIVGGGISGLAAAWECRRRCPHGQVVMFESSHRLGGVLKTIRRDDWLIECSADMFSTSPGDAVALCRQLGMEETLVSTRTVGRTAWVARQSKLYPVPRGFALMLPHRRESLLTTPVLSPAGRYRAVAELWIPPRGDDSDESLSSFAVRRFGREAFERLIQPLVGGIYSADPTRLSMQAALERFVDMERTHGSLTAAAWHERFVNRRANADRNRSGQMAVTVAQSATAGPPSNDAATGARYGMFVAPADGMGGLVERLKHQMGDVDVRLSSEVASLARASDGEGKPWELEYSTSSGGARKETFDAVVLATPVSTTASLLQNIAPHAATQAAQIQSASMAIVVLGFKRRQVPALPECFGFVVPEVDGRRVMACSVASQKFPGRAPRDHVLLRCFIGGQLHGDRVDWDDATLQAAALQELGDWIGAAGPPRFSEVIRWRHAMPQYELGHRERVARIQSELTHWPAIAVCGNAWSGVGIPACIASARRAVDSILRAFRKRDP